MSDVVTLFTRLRELMVPLLDWLGIRGEARTELVVAIVGALVPALLIALGGLLVKLCGRWLKRRTSRKPVVAEELDYLRWLARRMRTVGHQWHESPLQPVLPSVPLAAHTARRSWKQRLRGRADRLTARLFRHDSDDYAQSPMLADLELSLRAGFGRRVKIQNLASELRRFTKIVVLGDPGSGKSVCLRQAAHDIALRSSTAPEPSHVPIIVDMGAYDGWDGAIERKPLPVLTFIREQLRAEPSIKESPTKHPNLHISEHLEDLLLQGRVVAMFDALDEMPQDSYAERYRALREFMSHWEEKGNRFIYSCRALDYDPSFHVDEIIIDPFDRDRVIRFLQQHAPAVAETLYQRILDDPALEEMVGNPFYLQALAFINASARKNELDVPPTRGDLIRKFVAKLLQREAELKQDEPLASIPGGSTRLRLFLQQLAFALKSRTKGGTSVRSEDLSDVLGQYPDAAQLLWIASRARILGKRGPAHAAGARGLGDELGSELARPEVPALPARIEFVHHRLEEFFAAEELALRLARGDAIEAYIEDIWWQETVILAVTVTSDPRGLLDRILGRREAVESWRRELQALIDSDDGSAGLYLDLTANDDPSLSDVPFAVVQSGRIGFALEHHVPARWDTALRRLKQRGEQLARGRALFVAAEAVGQLPQEPFVEVRRKLQANLAQLVARGNSLHQVRALRAMRFIASDESVPVIREALASRSPWVRLTALRVLLRLNLEGRRARSLAWQLIIESFLRLVDWREHFAFLIDILEFSSGLLPHREATATAAMDEAKLLTVLRRLVPGFWKERGGRGMAVVVLALGLVGNLWAALAGLVWLVLVAATLAVSCVTSPVWGRWVRDQRGWRTATAPVAIDLACIISLVAAVPEHTGKILLTFFGSSYVVSLYGKERDLERGANGDERVALERRREHAETLRIVTRGGLSAGGALVTASPLWVTLFAALAAAQLVWAGVRFSRALRSRIAGRTRAFARLDLPREVGGSFCWMSLGFTAYLVAPVHLLFGMGVGALFWFLYRRLPLVLALGRVDLMERDHRDAESLSQYVDGMLRVVCDRSQPAAASARAALRLVNSPIADPALIERLQSLAETESKLPGVVTDALFQAIDAADTRIRRGRALSVEASWTRKLETRRGTPGEQLRPYFSVALVSLALAALAATLLRADSPSDGSREAYIVAGGLTSAASLLLAVATSRWTPSRLRASALTLGLGMLCLFGSRPLWTWMHGLEGGGPRLHLIDMLSWGAGVPAAGLGALLGLGIHLLSSGLGPRQQRPSDAGRVAKGLFRASVLALAFALCFFFAARALSHSLQGPDQGIFALGDSSAALALWSGILFAGLGAMLGMGIHVMGSDESLDELRTSKVGLLVGGIGLGLASVGLSPPVLDFVERYWAPAPLVEVAETGVVRLSRLPRDGRMLRAAVLDLGSTASPSSLTETFPATRAQLSTDAPWTDKPLEAILTTDSAVKGEVWLYAARDDVQAWQNLPNGCLRAESTDPREVVLQLDSSCSGGGRHRVILLVYSRARSERVRVMAQAGARGEALARSADEGRLLVNTLSAFVRPVWSSNF
jgi:hypothetical protein